MADDYCLRLVAPVPAEHLDRVAAAVATVTTLDQEALRESLAQPAGALIIRTGSLERVTEVKLALRREGVHTDSEHLVHASAVGRATTNESVTDSSTSGRATRIPKRTSQESAIKDATSPRSRSVIPDWLRRVLAWYLLRRRHEQVVIAGTATAVVGMLLPVAAFFGRSVSFMQLSEFRVLIVLALLGAAIWAAVTYKPLHARVSSAIAAVVVTIPFLQTVNAVSSVRADLRSQDDLFGFSRLLSDELRIHYFGWLVILAGIALVLWGSFARGWGEPAEQAGDRRGPAEDVR